METYLFYDIETTGLHTLAGLHFMHIGQGLKAILAQFAFQNTKRQSRTMAQTWQTKAETRYAEFPGNHFTVIDALFDPANAMVARIAELAQRVSR